MVADPEHQRLAEFRREFERVVVAIVGAQHTQPATLVGPLLLKPTITVISLCFELGARSPH